MENFHKDVKHFATYLNNECLKIVQIFLVADMLLLVSVAWWFCVALIVIGGCSKFTDQNQTIHAVTRGITFLLIPFSLLLLSTPAVNSFRWSSFTVVAYRLVLYSPIIFIKVRKKCAYNFATPFKNYFSY